ncbi:MAG TPA: ATP-dependent zinc metalloprotease FtsH [Gemmatimonadaceae bacterium]|nr:ATP-dependent zinc metalloprotease FtsH [Gemmatimonadaceae bacterium]
MPSPDPSGDGRKPRLLWLAAWAFGVSMFLLVTLFLGRDGEAERIPYSTFIASLDAGRIERVEIGEQEIRGTLKAVPGEERTEPGEAPATTMFVTTRVEHPGLVDELRRHDVTFTALPRSTLFDRLVWWVLPVILLLWLWMSMIRRTASQQVANVFGIAGSRAKVYVEQDTKVTFADVAGVDEAKQELQELVAFLRDPTRFGRLGARMPKGVLLVGPPGTGKTLFARAVAGEAGVPFFSINGSEFVELFVGVGAARVRAVFEQARKSAPCIIFIDELDALGRARGAGIFTGASDEKEQTLNQLLAELDGFSPERGVVLLAATNRPEILDPALLRAGRFDRQLVVDRPDRLGRRQILEVHVKAIRLAPGLDLDAVAGLTPGFTGADLANLVNEAALAATRRGADAVTLDDVTVAVERIVAGLARKSRVLTPRDREVTAYHEIGHAIVSLATPGTDPVQKVSIIPRSMGALGYTLQRPTEDRYIATRDELEAKLTVLLGGRAAELVAFGHLSTGAADDLVRATELARGMVMWYGMDDTVGHVVYGERGSLMLEPRTLVAPESRVYSEETAREIELAVRAFVQRALDRAVALLTLNREALDEGARRLAERESLTHGELPAVTTPPAESGSGRPRAARAHAGVHRSVVSEPSGA